MRGTPLWPAGHLPLKGGDWQLRRRRSSCDAGNWRNPRMRLISPLEGEMPGRAEGGASRPLTRLRP
ncbi:lytic murein transglycosylase [Mesorhizobium tamadayense]|uniref:Lytic murein transglycosylase n=1 Tax=Mesorhizobium tamadayense TaxID=425306 RepID=A0A3P3G247_9HYPH|nr:lytic murein transglycosylase [Mesorhizobium tamadayense]